MTTITDLGGPIQDPDRLAAVRQLGLLDTPAEEAFDRLTDLARMTMRVPAAIVSLVDEDRQYLKSSAGLTPELREVPTSYGLCPHVVASGQALFIEDVLEHPLHDNPAVSDLNIRAYAGVPLITRGGEVVGTFCVLDSTPRVWTDDEREALHYLAASVMTEIELRADVAERAQVELLDLTFDAVLVRDFDTDIIRLWNRSAEELYGFPRDQAIGRVSHTLLQTVHPIDVSEAKQILIRTGRWEGELTHTTGDGRIITVASRWTVQRQGGKPTAVIETTTDITHRKRAEEVLRASADRLRFMADSMPQKIFTAKSNGDIDYFNPQWTEFTGLAFEEIRDWGWTQFIHPDDVDENVRLWRRSIETGEPFEFEHRFRRADGVYRWHLSRARAMRDLDGAIFMWIGSNTDIDDQKRAEIERNRARAEAEAQRAHLHELVMQAPANICVLRGPHHVYDLVNPGYLAMIGQRDILGQPIREALPELAGQGFFELLDRVYATGEPFIGNEMQVVVGPQRGNPKARYVNFVYQPFRSGEGAVEGILVHGVDVTDQVLARRQVEDLAVEREATLGQIADGVVIADAEGRTTFVNQTGQVLLGVDATGVSPEDQSAVYGLWTMDGDRFPADDLPLVRAVRGRETITGVDIRVQRPDGTASIVQVTAAPIIARDGGLAGGVATFRDVTAERELGRQKDDFLSAVAHDLRNPIAVLQGHAQLLRRRVQRAPLDQEQILDGLALMEGKARVMTGLINELLDATRLRMGQHLELNRQPVDLVELVRQSVVGQDQIDAGHRIVLKVTATELVGSWDSARITRVVANLLSNATKYSPEGSEVTVTLGRDDRNSQPCAALAVRDLGIGIPARDLPHVFEWFYRAANVAGAITGSGIGLAGARRIVEQHGGTIEVESREGTGSTFTVRLPLGLQDDSTEPRGEHLAD